MSEYLNLFSNFVSVLLGASISGLVSYFTIKLKSSLDEKIKMKEIIFNEKKKLYFEYISKINIKFDFNIDDIEKNLAYLSCIELISGEELHQKCQNLPQVLVGISTSKDEEEKSKNISEYAKILREIKDAMRKELNSINNYS